MNTTVNSIDEYIAAFPEEISTRLNQIRETIKRIVPEVEETISYAMPAFRYHGILVYFAGYKNHIGLYALPSGNAAFLEKLTPYKTGKGSIQFPINKPLPLELIEEIVRLRAHENMQKMKAKNKVKD